MKKERVILCPLGDGKIHYYEGDRVALHPSYEGGCGRFWLVSALEEGKNFHAGITVEDWRGDFKAQKNHKKD